MQIFKNKFHLTMWSVTLASGLLMVCFWMLHRRTQDSSVCLSLAITFGTIFYHFAMRLAVGAVFHRIPLRTFQPEAAWFRQKRFEPPLYRRLKLKRWKLSVPTYNPEDFSLQRHTPMEVAQRSCEAELCHTCNVILSFVPILTVPIFGEFWVFFLTSLGAAAYDAIFVLLQRYNRPRLLRYDKRLHT